jgi:hypothetical protein
VIQQVIILFDFQIKDKQIRLVRVQPEDVELVTDFMSDVAGRWEPTTVSTSKFLFATLQLL